MMDIKRLYQYAKDGVISFHKHDTEDLIIWNYKQKCQYDFLWDDYTSMCRGLITDLEGKIIARPFPKFFNLGEHQGDDCRLPPINWDQPYRVTEKLDGSLGIVYPTKDGHAVATRGSFVSDQAIKGTEMLKKLDIVFDPKLTYLFEIIYPENRIVVDYGDTEDLVFLDVIDTETGESKDDRDTGMSRVEMANLKGDNREGIVVTFKDGTRIKIKMDEYVRLHRLITGTNARSIWDILRTGGDLKELVERVPDEYFDWVKKTEIDLVKKYQTIKWKCTEDYGSILHIKDRKAFALEANKRMYPSILFKMLDDRPIDELIWKMIRPEHSVPFQQEI